MAYEMGFGRNKFTRTAQLTILQIKIKQEICTVKESGRAEMELMLQNVSGSTL